MITSASSVTHVWLSTTRRSGTIDDHGRPPASTKTSLQQRLSARARERWPELAGIDVRFRGAFAYVTGRHARRRHHPADAAALRRIRRPAGASRSTSPAKTATKTPSCPPATSPAHPKTPSTPPAASTSATRPPGSEPPTNFRARPLSLGTALLARLGEQQRSRFGLSNSRTAYRPPRRLVRSALCRLRWAGHATHARMYACRTCRQRWRAVARPAAHPDRREPEVRGADLDMFVLS